MDEFTKCELLFEALPKFKQIEGDFNEFFATMYTGFIKKGVQFKLKTFNVGFLNGPGDGWVTELSAETGIDLTKYKIISDFLIELTGEMVGTEYATYEDKVLTYFINYVEGHLSTALKNGSLTEEIYDKDLSIAIAYDLFDICSEKEIEEILNGDIGVSN